MNRNIFLVDLRKCLTFMPEEERDETLRYYEELFDEAGPENEQKVIADLGSPTKVAVTIHREYSQNRPDNGDMERMLRGELPAPEAGQAATTELPPPPAAPEPPGETQAPPEAPEVPAAPAAPEIPEAPAAPEAETEVEAEAATETETEPEAEAATEPAAEPETEPAPVAEAAAPEPEMPTALPAAELPRTPPAAPAKPPLRMPAWAVALILVCTCWLWVPLLAAAIAIVLGVFAALLAVGAALTTVAGYLCISAIWAMGFLPDALLMLGAAAVFLAFGLVALWFAIWAGIRLAIVLVRGVSGLYRAIFRGKAGKEDVK